MERPDLETELLAKATAGDHAALERLLMIHHARLSADLDRRIPRPIRSIIAVEDVLQENYVIVFREIANFEVRGPGAFYAWLNRIAERRLLDAIKAERAAKRGGGRQRAEAPVQSSTGAVLEWLELLATHDRTPSMSAANREAVEVLQQVLAKLKPEYRDALRLRYIEGLPVAAAAERLGKSEGAVCVLCHRGIQRLREALAEMPEIFQSRM